MFDNGRAKAQDTHDRGTNLFSDGAAQHFKQSFFFNLVTFLPKLLGVEDLKIIYDFFATSHGKGAVDGIGGSAKRGGNKLPLPIFHISQPPGVMTKVLARKAIVKTAKDFAITGSAACPGVKFIYISKAEVESKMKALDELAFLGIKQLKGIRKLHHMEV